MECFYLDALTWLLQKKGSSSCSEFSSHGHEHRKKTLQLTIQEVKLWWSGLKTKWTSLCPLRFRLILERRTDTHKQLPWEDSWESSNYPLSSHSASSLLNLNDQAAYLPEAVTTENKRIKLWSTRIITEPSDPRTYNGNFIAMYTKKTLGTRFSWNLYPCFH